MNLLSGSTRGFGVESSTPPHNVYKGPETDGTPTLSRFLEPIPPSILQHASLSGE